MSVCLQGYSGCYAELGLYVGSMKKSDKWVETVGKYILTLYREEFFNSQNCPNMRRILFGDSEFPITT